MEVLQSVDSWRVEYFYFFCRIFNIIAQLLSFNSRVGGEEFFILCEIRRRIWTSEHSRGRNRLGALDMNSSGLNL